MRASIYVFVWTGWMNAMQSLLKSLLCEYKLNDLVAFKRLLPYLIPPNTVIIRNIQFTWLHLAHLALYHSKLKCLDPRS